MMCLKKKKKKEKKEGFFFFQDATEIDFQFLMLVNM